MARDATRLLGPCSFVIVAIVSVWVLSFVVYSQNHVEGCSHWSCTCFHCFHCVLSVRSYCCRMLLLFSRVNCGDCLRSPWQVVSLVSVLFYCCLPPNVSIGVTSILPIPPHKPSCSTVRFLSPSCLVVPTLCLWVFRWIEARSFLLLLFQSCHPNSHLPTLGDREEAIMTDWPLVPTNNSFKICIHLLPQKTERGSWHCQWPNLEIVQAFFVHGGDIFFLSYWWTTGEAKQSEVGSTGRALKVGHEQCCQTIGTTWRSSPNTGLTRKQYWICRTSGSGYWRRGWWRRR